MSDSKIEWTDKVWNPVTGCTKVSEGCRNCYAERHAKRFWGDRKFSDVQWHEDRIDQPFRWKKPVRIFVNSMGDLFHQDVSNEFISDVWDVMQSNLEHTFIILTKRPERMYEYSKWHEHWYDAFFSKNIWLGVSVDDQKTADERIPWLLKTPAAVRFISYEPSLGPVDFTPYLWICPECGETADKDTFIGGRWRTTGKSWQHYHGYPVGYIQCIPRKESIDWIICGGESGPSARPMHPDWARSVRDQCQAAGVLFFFKQWGEWLHENQFREELIDVGWSSIRMDAGNNYQYLRVGKKNAGRLLDGFEWNQFPEVMN